MTRDGRDNQRCWDFVITHSHRARLLALGLIGGLLTRTVAAQESVPAKLALAVMLRVLAYDRNLEVKGTGDFVVGVPFEAGQESQRDELIEAAKGLSFQKRSLRVVPLEMRAGSFKKDDSVEKSGAGVLVVLNATSPSALQSILEAANLGKLYTLSLDPKLVEKWLALGVANNAGKPQLLLNLAAAKRMNASFEPSVLKLAKIYQ